LLDPTPVRAVRLLRAGGTVAFKQSDRAIEVSVPSVDLHEVVAFEL
jgi:hypothetical protein